MMRKKPEHKVKTSVCRIDCEVPPCTSANWANARVEKLDLLASSKDAIKNRFLEGEPDNDFLNKSKGSSKNYKYHTPEVNTSKNYTKMMKAVESFNPKLTATATPSAQQLLATRITKKLNFPIHETVYKNLIPININDSIMMSASEENLLPKNKYQSKSNKDPVPDLRDFLEPIPSLDHNLIPHNRTNELNNPIINYFTIIHNIVTDGPGY